MQNWLGIGLIIFGLGLIIAAIRKRRSRMRAPVAADVIRPEFAAMGAIVRPIILFVVGIFALNMTLFYLLLGGQRFLSILDFAGILFFLAAYAGWLIVATSRAAGAPARDPAASDNRSAA